MPLHPEGRPLIFVVCPLSPPVIRTIRIIESPFEDLVPRITRAEKLAQQEARLEAAKEREQRELRKKAKK